MKILLKREKTCRLGQGTALNRNYLPMFAVVLHANDYRDIISVKIKVTYINTHTRVCVYAECFRRNSKYVTR